MLMGALTFSPVLGAQERAIPAFDFELTLDSVGWRKSSNVSQLFTLPLQRAGRAYTGYDFTQGNTLIYNQAEEQHRFAVGSEAYQRLSSRLMLYGAASFSTNQEKEVVGSAFYAPSSKPFDITFMDETNRGDRKEEAYHLVGAVSYQLSKQWSLGAKFDYEAINRARTKDLRHNNTILSLKASAAISYKLSKALTLGVDYRYDRYIETLSFNTYGTTDQQFMSLINWGAFSGKQELFDNYGYTAKGGNNPFVEHNHQLGMQVAWHIAPRLTLFNELHAALANGYYGKKATSSILYTEHNGSSWRNQTTLSYKGVNHFQQLAVSLSSWKRENHENEWRSETSSAGNTVINYYGQNLVGEKKYTTAQVNYLLASGEKNGLPSWLFKLDGGVERRDLRSITYPYYRSQKLTLQAYSLAVSRQLALGKSALWIDLGVAYRTGSGTNYTDGVYTTPSTEVGTPNYQNTFLAYEYAYLTANRVAPHLGAHFNFELGGIGCFAQLKYEIETMLQTSYTEKHQQQFTARLGIRF